MAVVSYENVFEYIWEQEGDVMITGKKLVALLFIHRFKFQLWKKKTKEL